MTTRRHVAQNKPVIVEPSKQERETLERRAREATSPYWYLNTGQAHPFAAKGWQNKEIGEALDLPRQVV